MRLASLPLIIICFTLFGITAFAQESKPVLNFFTKKGRGVGFVTADSAFSVNFQFRIQNRAVYTSKTKDDFGPEEFEFRVRRLRMKFEGFVADPKLTYYIQLSLSRGDMDWRGLDDSGINSSVNVVRDAVIYYTPTKNIRLGFGQTKLPGNRQRVISSGDQQFYERSIVNARFNIDRDFGFFAQYSGNLFNLRGALTSGEGRNSEKSNSGLAYTGRIEFLPFGKFTGTNDYQEGDLAREEFPKLSLGGTFHYNERALRQAGQLGNDLYSARNIKTYEVDMLCKYNGWAWYNEYMVRDTNDPVTINPADVNKYRAVYIGKGILTQMSYLFKNNFELAARYAAITPSNHLYDNVNYSSLQEKKTENIELGVTKYIKGHRLKIQGGIVYSKLTDELTHQYYEGYWSSIFQIELGI